MIKEKDIIAIKSIKCGDNYIIAFCIFIFTGVICFILNLVFKDSHFTFWLILSLILIIISVINYIDYNRMSDILITKDESNLIIHSKIDKIIPLSEIIDVKQKNYVSYYRIILKYGNIILETEKQGNIKVIYVEDVEEVKTRILMLLRK